MEFPGQQSASSGSGHVRLSWSRRNNGGLDWGFCDTSRLIQGCGMAISSALPGIKADFLTDLTGETGITIDFFATGRLTGVEFTIVLTSAATVGVFSSSDNSGLVSTFTGLRALVDFQTAEVSVKTSSLASLTFK